MKEIHWTLQWFSLKFLQPIKWEDDWEPGSRALNINELPPTSPAAHSHHELLMKIQLYIQNDNFALNTQIKLMILWRSTKLTYYGRSYFYRIVCSKEHRIMPISIYKYFIFIPKPTIHLVLVCVIDIVKADKGPCTTK